MNNLVVRRFRTKEIDLGYKKIPHKSLAGEQWYEECLEDEDSDALVVQDMDFPNRNIFIITPSNQILKIHKK